MRAVALLLGAALLAGCPEERGYTRQRVPAARVPAAVSVEPGLPPLPLPPPAPEPEAQPTSAR